MAKKFKDTKIGKFLSANGSGIVNSLGDVLPDNGVFGLVKNLIDKDDKMPVEDKEKAMKLLEMEMTEMQEINTLGNRSRCLTKCKSYHGHQIHPERKGIPRSSNCSNRRMILETSYRCTPEKSLHKRWYQHWRIKL